MRRWKAVWARGDRWIARGEGARSGWWAGAPLQGRFGSRRLVTAVRVR